MNQKLHGFKAKSHRVDSQALSTRIEHRFNANGATFTCFTLNLEATLTLILGSVTGGDRPNVPDTLIIVTDGLPNQEVDRTIPEAINAQIDGTHLSCLNHALETNQMSISDDEVLKNNR